MNFSVRIRPSLRRAAFVAALGALMVPAGAGASVHAQASAKKKVKLPVVKSVKPMNVVIGETLEIRGKYFIRGRYKNSVVFKRDRGRAVFVKAKVGTKKLLRVTVPKKLEREFAKVNNVAIPTRFRVRVLTKKLGKRWTKLKKSPVVGFKPGTAPAPPVPTPPARTSSDGDCDLDGVVNAVDADDDNDLLSDNVENGMNATLVAKYGSSLERIMNTCSADSDEDGVEDGYEYRSARDLNDDEYQSPNSYLPYPGKKPYANPLFADSGTDYDGDSLTLLEEQKLWKFVYTTQPNAVRSLEQLYYSDGMQYSIYARGGTNNRRRPALPAAGYDKQIAFENWTRASGYEFVELPDDDTRYALLDANRDGTVSNTAQVGYVHSERYYLDRDDDTWLSDDERDEDADGLSNYDEAHGRTMGPEWWDAKYPRESPFTKIRYAGTELDDPDTDGDGVRDGADDQDHDDIPNLMELSRKQATGRPYDDPETEPDAGNSTPTHGRVNPFNPCLPDVGSRTCPRVIPFDNAWAPFDGLPYTAEGNDPNYLVLN